MVCQYSTRGFVSSEKHDRAVDPGAAEGGGDAFDIVTVFVVRSRALPEPLTATTGRAHATHVWRSRSCGRRSAADIRLDHLASAPQDVIRGGRPSLREGTSSWTSYPSSVCASMCKNISCMILDWLGIAKLATGRAKWRFLQNSHLSALRSKME
jgi:hypothetical protein